MPLYAYFCPDCQQRFTQQRSISQRDAPAECPSCGGLHPSRLISLPMLFTREQGGQLRPVGASPCAGCAATSCAGCTSAR